MKKQVLHGFLAAALVMCLLAVSFAPAIAAAEAAEGETKKNPVLMVIQHLKTVDWQKLPEELKERIDAAGWKDLQDKLKEFDWKGALETIKSFFTDIEWGELGQEIERQFQRLIDRGAEGWASLEEYLSSLNVDDFVRTIQNAAEQASQTVKDWAEEWAAQAQEWAGQAEDAVTDVIDTVEDAVTSFLDSLGIF